MWRSGGRETLDLRRCTQGDVAGQLGGLARHAAACGCEELVVLLAVETKLSCALLTRLDVVASDLEDRGTHLCLQRAPAPSAAWTPGSEAAQRRSSRGG
jgi:hypothetical protein